MSSSMTDRFSHSTNAPAQISANVDVPRLPLDNQNSNVANFQPLTGFIRPTKPINKISTYFIWSIFNLLFVPFGLLCCFFSYQVNKFKMQYRYELANKWSQRTFVLNLMTTLMICGLIITIAMLHYDYAQRNSPGNQTRTTLPFIAWQPGR